MKEHFPNLAREIDFQELQDAQSPKEEHTKAHHNYVTQDDRGQNLKSSERKGQLPTKEFP